MILPSWFVGLLEKPALLGLHQDRVSRGGLLARERSAGTSAIAAV